MAPFHAASVELCGFLFDRGKTGGGIDGLLQAIATSCFFLAGRYDCGAGADPDPRFPGSSCSGLPAIAPMLQQFFLQIARSRTVAFAYTSFAAGTCGLRRKGKPNH